MTYDINAQTIAKLFAEKGFKYTAKWIIFSFDEKFSPFLMDIDDILKSFRIEFRSYRREYYNNPEFNADCFETVFKNIISGMSSGQKSFQDLTTKLIPLMSQIIENNRAMDNLMTDAASLDLDKKFYRCCHYYQNLWEGDYKFVRRNLLAMKRLKEGKAITITETLALLIDGTKIEPKASLEEVTPESLSIGDHEHLRNAVAHSNYKFIQEEGKMQFWDIEPRTQHYSWGPKKYTFEEFTKSLIEVNLFCEAFGLQIILLMAFEDIAKNKRRS